MVSDINGFEDNEKILDEVIEMLHKNISDLDEVHNFESYGMKMALVSELMDVIEMRVNLRKGYRPQPSAHR